ncbi:MAG TPA: class II aldolase/adducin family protein [Methylophilaceae bacterium]|nr:class II aldolase/adducin family protein [Methylophilaceae bacterium]
MQTLREQLLNTTRRLHELGLNKGTSGNASVRDNEGFLVTPSGMEVAAMTQQDMVAMDFDGQLRANGTSERKPSSEWRFHRDILHARPEINAVIHAHAMFATTLACLHKDIPAFHYMIAVTGGDSIRCAPYALFGSQALSDHALAALQDRRACLLANHGMIILGETPDEALDIAVEVENLCEQYGRALQIDEPHVLSESQMAEVLQSFRGYGRWAKPGKA